MTARRSALTALLASLVALLPPHARAGGGPTAPSAEPPDRPLAAAADPPAVSIRINAVVTDRRGRPLLDLQPGDFELDDNGVLQRLSSVEMRSAPRAPTAEAQAAPDEDERTAASEAGTRVFAVFLDEFNVAPGPNSARVRELATRFLTEYVRPPDLVYVMKPMGPVSGLRFTRDRAAARAAIDAFEGRKGDLEARTPFEAQYIGRTPAAVEGARAQIVTTGLRELTMKLGELRPVRAAVLIVSEGFVGQPGVPGRRLPDWDGLAKAASHFNLPVYTLDPRDLSAPPPGDGQEAGDAGSTALRSLAVKTGGEAASDIRQALPALARISRDLDSYYVLTYQPSQAADGRFHPIAVRTTRKGAEVRVPSGYWSPLSREWRAFLDRDRAPVGPSQPARTLRRSRLADMWFGFEPAADGRLRLLFTWELTPAGAALRARPHDVVLRASTPQGETLFERDVEAIPPPGTEPSAGRAQFPVVPGRVQLDFRIRAADGVEVEAGAQDIEVPAARGAGPVLLQPQFIRTRTARDFRWLSEQADAPPSPSRVFSRRERILLRVPSYNPDGAPVDASVALSNSRGQAIRQLERLPAAGASVPPQFDLPLAFLAPGEYSVEVRVVSPTGTARQLIRFRLTG